MNETKERTKRGRRKVTRKREDEYREKPMEKGKIGNEKEELKKKKSLERRRNRRRRGKS